MHIRIFVSFRIIVLYREGSHAVVPSPGDILGIYSLGMPRYPVLWTLGRKEDRGTGQVRLLLANPADRCGSICGDM